MKFCDPQTAQALFFTGFLVATLLNPIGLAEKLSSWIMGSKWLIKLFSKSA